METKKTPARGRPKAYTVQDIPMKVFNVRMTNWHARQARKLGGRNLSKGLRHAIEVASEKKYLDPDD